MNVIQKKKVKLLNFYVQRFLLGGSIESILFMRGSLNYPVWGNQTIQIYDDFEGFPS